MSYNFDERNSTTTFQIIKRKELNKWIEVNSLDEHYLQESIWSNAHGYAKRYKEVNIDGKRIRWVEYLHRLIMNACEGDIVDHINGNTSDNRRSNLRIVNKSINALNSWNRSGATQTKATGKWFARIKHDGITEHLGTFDTKQEAAQVYEKRKKEILNVV